jgi:broad specificity phosphatase PhoE
MTIYIFRHGMAVHPNLGYGDRVLTAELLPEGIPPIERLGQYLIDVESDYQVCSDVLRCRQTAAIVTEATGKPFLIDPRLKEYHQETFDQLAQRTKAFHDEILQSTAYQNVMVCTHGSVIAALKHYLIDGYFERRHETDYIQTGQLLIVNDDKSVEVVDFNKEVLA